jgi:hypothetical protein
MPALYALMGSKAPNDKDVHLLKDTSKFPFPYLSLLWSTLWKSPEGYIQLGYMELCSWTWQAVMDPTSRCRPEDAILAVQQFAASRAITEAELRVFLQDVWDLDSSMDDDTTRLLFFAALTLKLCQKSDVSMPRIFSLFMQARNVSNDKAGIFCILPLLRSLPSKTSLLGDNSNPTNELSPELDAFSEAFWSTIKAASYSYLNGNLATVVLDGESNYAAVSLLSLLTAVSQPHLVAKQIIRRSGRYIHLWRSAIRYCDEHGESARLCRLDDGIHSRTCSGQSHPPNTSSFDSSVKQAVK